MADLVGDLHDRLRAQPTVEMVVEEHLGRPMYLVTARNSHPPILPSMRVFTSLDDVAAASGEELGTTEWVTIEQDRVDKFADATGDHQWIHVDVERAAEGPFGGTIAHGYLTLSLVPWLGSQVFSLETPGAKLNYGVNKVRFPNPVRVGSRVRSTVSVGDVTDLPSGKQLTLKHVVEIEGEEKPACVAETVVLLLP
jgi:acyl dehydratase